MLENEKYAVTTEDVIGCAPPQVKNRLNLSQIQNELKLKM